MKQIIYNDKLQNVKIASYNFLYYFFKNHKNFLNILF